MRCAALLLCRLLFNLDGVPEEQPLHVELHGRQFLGQVRLAVLPPGLTRTACSAVHADVAAQVQGGHMRGAPLHNSSSGCHRSETTCCQP